MRKKIIAGNWKLNCGKREEAEPLVKELLPLLSDNTSVDVVLCPPYTALVTVAELLPGAKVALGAQDVFWKEKGAYTGQVSASMLAGLCVQYVIVGHSECRGRFGVPEPDFTDTVLKHFGDSDETVNRKAKAAFAAGLTPILCVGETLQERKAGNADKVVSSQTAAGIEGLSAEQVSKLVLAYEPVWAIGTGEVCAADEADRICGVIRSTVAAKCGQPVADAVRIQYGGSVKPSNANELLHKPNIDGALVGGAALKAADFAGIIKGAA